MLFYYITDRNQFPGTDVERRARLLERIGQAAEAGVDCIQLREKDMAAQPLAHLAEEALRRIEPHRTKLLINSRLDIALAVGAAGVHLTSGDFTASQARHHRRRGRPPRPEPRLSGRRLMPLSRRSAAGCR